MSTTKPGSNTPPLLREIDTMLKRAAPAFNAEDALQLQAGVPPAAIERPTPERPPRIGSDGRPEAPKELPLPDHRLMRYDPENPGKVITRTQLESIKNHATNGGCRLCSAFLRGLQSGTAGTRMIIAQEQKQAQKRAAQAQARASNATPAKTPATQHRTMQQPSVTRAQAQVQTIDRQIAALQEAGAKMIANPGLQVQLANTVYLLMQRRAALSDAR